MDFHINVPEYLADGEPGGGDVAGHAIAAGDKVDPHGNRQQDGRDGADDSVGYGCGTDHIQHVGNGIYVIVQAIGIGIVVNVGERVAQAHRGEYREQGRGGEQNGHGQEEGRGTDGFHHVHRRVVREQGRRRFQRAGTDGAVGDIPAAVGTNHNKTLHNH